MGGVTSLEIYVDKSLEIYRDTSLEIYGGRSVHRRPPRRCRARSPFSAPPPPVPPAPPRCLPAADDDGQIGGDDGQIGLSHDDGQTGLTFKCPRVHPFAAPPPRPTSTASMLANCVWLVGQLLFRRCEVNRIEKEPARHLSPHHATRHTPSLLASPFLVRRERPPALGRKLRNHAWGRAVERGRSILLAPPQCLPAVCTRPAIREQLKRL